MRFDGLTGEYQERSFTVKVAIATFIGIAWYNAVELCVLVFVTFTRFEGLYFWSLLVAGVAGVVPYSVGYLIKFFHLMDSVWLSIVFISIGWWFMVTGQSFVLYSRLHLVQRDQKLLRRVLAVILANVLVLHVPTTILTFGSNSGAGERFVRAYAIMEKIQMTGFCLQELLLSTLYIIEAIKILRLSSENGNRRIMYQLLSINLMFIVMDMGLLGAAYASLYAIETTLKATIYSIKLKLEFAVLGKLVRLVNPHSWNPGFNRGPNGLPDFVDASRLTSDVTHAPASRSDPLKPPWALHGDPDMAMNEQCGSQYNASKATRSTHSSAWNTLFPRNSAMPENATMPVDIVSGVLPSPRTSRAHSLPSWHSS
ncbi:hypothetical protein CPC735_004810 [Coccidioides posadasii C735 delta SOWgp]|uniref:DUF7703 domain-containing protein n=1 Tax=Coccidioides posadasii (strain C735) TaxID=222929 RepID=C5P997_COCP7|nr:hypothetical protein CPC735_004810 [Coccidioides posadasii C735 delta SOWgp]EER26309.1 hypothetical protein CPC735_004810 [Coccidioides posadasii C735 delta SOWgp]|eukprot:XP_003068454.1 hypothetical protein CPC735_004810 [Coccidioides posadasii C735 delta SOWgp]